MKRALEEQGDSAGLAAALSGAQKTVEEAFEKGGNGPWGPLAHLPESCRPHHPRIFNVNNDGNVARVDVTTDGIVKWAGGGRSPSWISLSGISFMHGTIGHKDVRLVGGWSPFQGWGTPSYCISEGMCAVEGVIHGGSWGPLAELPDGCRPNKRLVYSVNSHDSQARVDVNPQGVVAWAAGDKKTPWLGLNGIIFGAGGVGQSKLDLKGTWEAYGEDFGAPSFAIYGAFISVEGLVRQKEQSFIDRVAGQVADHSVPDKPWKVLENLEHAGHKAGIFLEINQTNDQRFLPAVGSAVKEIFQDKANADPDQLMKLKESTQKAAQKQMNFQKLQEGLKGKSWGVIAQLPSCCRPEKTLTFNVNNHEGSSRVDVHPNGNIEWKAGGRNHAWLSLSGIVFPNPKMIEVKEDSADGYCCRHETYEDIGIFKTETMRSGKYCADVSCGVSHQDVMSCNCWTTAPPFD